LLPCLVASLPPCLLASLLPCLVASLPPCLLASLSPCLLAFLPPCLLASLPPCLLALLPPYLLASLPPPLPPPGYGIIGPLPPPSDPLGLLSEPSLAPNNSVPYVVGKRPFFFVCPCRLPSRMVSSSNLFCLITDREVGG
jgi:hypothetical protein